MKKNLWLTLLAIIGATSISANNTKESLDTIVVATQPLMSCSGCEKRIMENIRFVKGTKKITT